MGRKNYIQAIAYLRTSSAANVGADKDSDKRQRETIQRFAKSHSYRISEEFYDADVSGADHLQDRPGFSALLDKIESNGIRVVIIEDASRLARDLLVQELGIISLIERGVTVVTSSGDDLTETSDPMKVCMRQIAGAFAQLEKSRLVMKLRHARERLKQQGKKVEGRKAHWEINPAAVLLAKRLHRANPISGERMSLRRIASELEAAGFINERGERYNPNSIKAMIEGKRPKV